MAIDWEIPVIQDDNGDGHGFPSPLNPDSEGIRTKGYAVEDENTYVFKKDGEIAFADSINGQKKLSELSGGGGVTKEFVIAMAVGLG
jgi:hypothetical protein